VLFSSFTFAYGFLPVALLGFFAASHVYRPAARVWLVAASIVFYGWWDPAFVPVLVVSVGFNYAASLLIAAVERRPILQSWVLGLAITGDLAALAYYKYLSAVIGFAALHFGLAITPPVIVLPLGISFFSFTQIGYLIDCKQGVAKERGFMNYLLFVTFFPHLIAGPILHHQEIMPQFADRSTYRFSAENFSVGLVIFAMGMLKKCLFADLTSAGVTESFAAPEHLTLFAAWNAVLRYSLQLYFDFSGYSDMAIGLARMFNVRFPLNFNSPYKATSVIDYWQRWHMTLTRYLTGYIYNPLALWVTRRRLARRKPMPRGGRMTVGGFASMVVFPTFITMVLAGIWHGAGLQFLVFGLLHFVYLSVNHVWRMSRPRGRDATPERALTTAGNVLLTYLCVLVASVFFRAPSVGQAVTMLGGLIGLHGGGPPLAVPTELATLAGSWGTMLVQHGIIAPMWHVYAWRLDRGIVWIGGLYLIVWLMPNTQQIMRLYEPALGRILPGPFPALCWRLNLRWALVSGSAVALAAMAVGGTQEFLYFQF
jgi:D-alanyl-lipoteichoic acid acyltransferase DltB (MBOAT superfamily)